MTDKKEKNIQALLAAVINVTLGAWAIQYLAMEYWHCHIGYWAAWVSYWLIGMLTGGLRGKSGT